jgi:NADH-quinone oxidoreductase subunit H
MGGHWIDLFPLSQGITLWLLGLVAAIVRLVALAIPPVQAPLDGFADWLLLEPVVTLVAWLVAITVMIVWITLIHLLSAMWIERKFYARLQDRRGIMLGMASLPFWPFNRSGRGSNMGMGFLQNVADGLKLFQKEIVTPEKADFWMYHIAPVLIASSTLMLFAPFPFSEGFVVAPLEMGILFILAAFSLAPLGILIAGWAQNNKYTLIGGMRGAAMLIAYEIPLILSVIAVVMLAGTLDPMEFVRRQQGGQWFALANPLALALFFIAIIAEMERIPFDLPEAEAELVEGWTTEYGGMRFGLIFGFKWLRALAGSGLVTLLFLGGWDGPALYPEIFGLTIPFPPQEFWFLLKMYIVFLLFVWISWSVPRVRIDQLISAGWKKLIPLALLAIFLSAALKVAGVVG